MKNMMEIVSMKAKGNNGPPPKLAAPGAAKEPAVNPFGKPKAPPVEDQPEAEGRAIPQEAVCFRTGSQTCGNCEYMAASGECSWLKFGVEPGDSCNLFEEKTEGPEAQAEAKEAPEEVAA